MCSIQSGKGDERKDLLSFHIVGWGAVMINAIIGKNGKEKERKRKKEKERKKDLERKKERKNGEKKMYFAVAWSLFSLFFVAACQD